MPIAANGLYAVIPTQQSTAGNGKASIELGFGPENSKTLDDGGKAVRRQDLNGLFNRLSQMLYWIQSGGQWTYKTTVNYTVNCMVIYQNQFYICRKDNGPSMGILVTPGNNETYWIQLSKFGDFLRAGSTVDNLQFAIDGLNASFNLTGSTQASITPSGGNGYFTVNNAFTVNSGVIPAGVYNVKDVLQRLVNAAHTHSATSVSGNGQSQYCTYCDYCDYCRVCCDDCCHDCGDDTY